MRTHHRLLLALAGGLLAASCSGYAPGFGPCQVACSATGACPATHTCGADGFCHLPGDGTSCAPGGGDGGTADGPPPDGGAGDGAGRGDALIPDGCVALAACPADACGTVDDGCGGTLECGGCTDPATCGGGGTPNRCGCTPRTCVGEEQQCGSLDDGCGGTAVCGGCSLPWACDVAHHCRCTPGTFSAQSVDVGGPVGAFASVAVGADEQPRLAYLDATFASSPWVRYAWLSSGFWMRETVVTGGTAPRLVLDGSGAPLISYHDAGLTGVRLARRTGPGTWSTEAVGPSTSAGSTLAVDGAGGVHVSFLAAAGGDLTVAYRPAAGAWQARTVAAGVPAGVSHALALGPTGLVHVVYRLADGRVEHASGSAGGSFTAELVDQAGGAGVAVAVTAGGVVHVAYEDAAAHELTWARRGLDAGWTIELVAATGAAGLASTGLGVDEIDGVHVAWFDRSSGRFRYAHRPYGGAFAAQDLADLGASATGGLGTLAVDDESGVHVGYHQPSGGVAYQGRVACQ